MNGKNLSPIALFVYNRPYHTLKTLESLNNNHLSDQSSLYIFSDGPKINATEEDLNKIKDTREVIRRKKWCGEVFIEESADNKGLADCIVNGVTKIINEHGKVIVLEDDLVTSPYFLDYMNDALNFYKDENKVMHISGYMFPVKEKLPPTFFYNTASCWGWATWKRAWDHFEPDARLLREKIEKVGLVKKFNIEGTYGFMNQLERNANGTAKTWAVKWYASIFLNNGLSLHPYPSLVNNIGHDGTGEHYLKSDKYNWPKLADKIEISKIELKESLTARKAMRNFYKNMRPSFIIRLKNKLNNLFFRKIKILTLLLIKTAREWLLRVLGFFMGIHYVPRNYLFRGKFDSQDIIVDVGCGFEAEFSMHMIKNFGLKSLGIDPTKKHFDSLKKIESTGGKFRHYDLAISANTGKILFNESESNESGSILSEHKNVKKDKIKTYSVKTFSLADLPAYLGMNKIKYLKLDVEGVEYEIIKNLKKEDVDKYSQIFIEFHHHCTDYSVKDTLDAVRKMIKLGFKKFTLNNHDYLFYK
ncbi:MAG: FkbM family methyltransferase [Patescibacteria group bacterium]|nr:FkbM family methyltransferase [Patescibacteria group bacterium]MDE2218365.1 FkbM family methyltransferase [Patescibacteria group bacterium]